jgi:transcriptional regulator GlxA family with amidase domain
LKSKSTENSNESIKAVLLFIEDNFSEKLTIEDLAKTAKLSKYHFIRVFKAYTDTTPIEYLKEVRISKAKELLKQNKTDITNTALMVGFDNISYFIKVFKEICGVTPLKFSKNKD